MTRDTRESLYHAVTRKRGSRGAEAPRVEAAPALEEPTSEGAPKKERVLHTRVPAVLEQELKRFADNLRVPVSNLVRTILEDALQVADAATESVEGRLRSAAQQLQAERDKLRERVKFNPLKDVFAFQQVTLAQQAQCAKCLTPLAPGTRAHLGLHDGPPRRGQAKIFVCDACLPKN